MADEMVAVTELVEGDVIDLQGGPFADPGHGPGPHMDECTFQYETSVVCGEDGPGELEERDCYRLDFVHMGGERGQGFPPEHKVHRVGHVDPPAGGGIRDGQWRLRWQLAEEPVPQVTPEQAVEWLKRQPGRPMNEELIRQHANEMKTGLDAMGDPRPPFLG